VTALLTLNPGSSSLKATVRDGGRVLLRVTVDRLGTDRGSITVGAAQRPFTGGTGEAVDAIARQLHRHRLPVSALAHRVVHGGPHHWEPQLVDDRLLADLRAAIPLAPLHLPGNLATVEHARRAWPGLPQVACFDTGFHAGLPPAAVRLPVPDELVRRGVRRYGFHGLSVRSVLDAHPELDQLVVAHLGSGCSATAVADGRPRHTTMSLTPTGGMMSATRTGDLDPEVVLYLIAEHGYDVPSLRELVDRQGGLAGIAGGRHDVRDLLAAADDEAALALEVFADSAARAIAGCATALDRWQALVFTGGVGEHAGQLREAICARLLAVRGSAGDADGSAAERLAATGLRVLVVPADEEAVLDRLAREVLGTG